MKKQISYHGEFFHFKNSSELLMSECDMDTDEQ